MSRAGSPEDWGSDEGGQELTKEQLIEYGGVLSTYFSHDHDHRFVFEKFLKSGKDGAVYLIQSRPQYAAVSAPNRHTSRSPTILAPPDQMDTDIPEVDVLALLPQSALDAAERPRTAPAAARGRWRGRGWNDDSHGKRIVLKIDLLAIGDYFEIEFAGSDFGDADNNCEKEKQYLQSLQNCQHIVKLIQIPNDPLARTSNDLTPHLLTGTNRFFEEYLENGTVVDLIDKLLAAHRARGIVPARFPNRMLWRIFLCLVKALVGITWPNQPRSDAPERCLLDKPMTSIQHGDIHEGNLMFGNEYHPDCHSLVPVLKVIDFAGAETKDDDLKKKIGDEGPPPEGVTDNIFSIGKTMAILMAPDQWDALSALYPEKPETVGAYVPFMSTIVETVGVYTANYNNCPWIDREMKSLVVACLAVNPEQRPRLLELDVYVQQAVNTKDEAHYQNLNNEENARRQQQNLPPRNIYDVSIESDFYMRRLVDEFMYSVPAMRPAGNRPVLHRAVSV